MKKYYIFATILFQFVFVQAQNRKTASKLAKAHQEYDALRFMAVTNLLKPVLKKDSANVEAQELMANSYRNLRNYDEALQWYQKLSKAANQKPEWSLYYAEALATKQRYEESEQWYRTYLAKVKADKRASSFIKTDPSIFSQDKGEWQVLPVSINSAAAEYSPVYYKDGLLFISNRNTQGLVRHVFQWDQTPYTNFYVVDHLTDLEPNVSVKAGKNEKK